MLKARPCHFPVACPNVLSFSLYKRGWWLLWKLHGITSLGAGSHSPYQRRGVSYVQCLADWFISIQAFPQCENDFCLCRATSLSFQDLHPPLQAIFSVALPDLQHHVLLMWVGFQHLVPADTSRNNHSSLYVSVCSSHLHPKRCPAQLPALPVLALKEGDPFGSRGPCYVIGFNYLSVLKALLNYSGVFHLISLCLICGV